MIVVGGGNTAVEDALYLTRHAGRVTVVHRRDRFRAEQVLQKRLFAHPKVQVRWNTTLEDIFGEGAPRKVVAAQLKNLETGAVERMPVDGVFVAIGHSPATTVFRGHVPTDEDGYIVTKPDSTATIIPGVFAAGDVKDRIYRQAVTAAGMGCMAALEAEKFLAEHEGEAGERRAERREEQMIGAWD